MISPAAIFRLIAESSSEDMATSDCLVTGQHRISSNFRSIGISILVRSQGSRCLNFPYYTCARLVHINIRIAVLDFLKPMASGSQRAVITAIAGNGILTVLKFAVAVPTHSAAMMNEAVHSLMDTLNQIFLVNRPNSG